MPQKVYIYYMLRGYAGNDRWGRVDGESTERRCRGIVEEEAGIFMPCLDDEKLLNVLASGALAHAVPGSIGENTTYGPHDRYSDLSGI